jgi:hypothetical protein
MVIFIDASLLVLQQLETAMAHDPIMNPPCKERKLQHGEQAGLYFDDFKTTQQCWINSHLFIKT